MDVTVIHGFRCVRLPCRLAGSQPATATCSIGVRCGHSQALIVCHSCARFEGGRTHYCRNCFKAYHPWYRVAHKWSPLEDAESIKEELDRHAYTASLERDVADIRGLLAITASWTGELDTQDVDTKVILYSMAYTALWLVLLWCLEFLKVHKSDPIRRHDKDA